MSAIGTLGGGNHSATALQTRQKYEFLPEKHPERCNTQHKNKQPRFATCPNPTLALPPTTGSQTETLSENIASGMPKICKAFRNFCSACRKI